VTGRVGKTRWNHLSLYPVEVYPLLEPLHGMAHNRVLEKFWNFEFVETTP
jgi:hypothetical protein